MAETFGFGDIISEADLSEMAAPGTEAAERAERAKLITANLERAQKEGPAAGEKLIKEFKRLTGREPTEAAERFRGQPVTTVPTAGLFFQGEELKEFQEAQQSEKREAGALEGVESAIGSQASGFKSAVQQQLDRLLAESGIQAGLQREQVGAGAAGRGLGRSSIGARKLGDVTLAEQEKRGQLREATRKTLTAADRLKEQTLKSIGDQRERIKEGQRISEEARKKEIETAFSTQAIQQQAQKEIFAIELNASESAFFTSLIGSLAGGIASLGAGLLTGGGK